ncbi:MAG: hypothetical protein GC168_04865 [Candidatus Hydrogenedens sp.]|nr:hypothetical protein [Candidatus Hydrogenedens sp.]
MAYTYLGYLGTLIYSPDTREIAKADSVSVSPAQLLRWTTSDDSREPEWKRIPVECTMGERGVVLRGKFDRIRQIDSCGPEDPSFWVPLSSERKTTPFPIDLRRFPVFEVTYRCRTENVRPSYNVSYTTGQQVEWLPPRQEWTTAAHLLRNREFPNFIDQVTLRLYTVARSTEELEVESLRFRALTAAEREALAKAEKRIAAIKPPLSTPQFDSFMPIGVSMGARQAARMAELMEVPQRDYWRLAMEDIARSHHNAIWIEDAAELSHTEWTEILGLASSFGLRLVPEFNWDLARFRTEGPELVERFVHPHAESESVLAWSLRSEPGGAHFDALCQARSLFENADPRHPLVFLMREPNSFPLFAPHFAAAGISYFKSGVPWRLGEMVRAHQHICEDRQFWIQAPAFIYATSTPHWHTCPELRLMLNHAFCGGARGWFSYTYHNVPAWHEGPFKRSLTGPFLTFSDLWSELGHRIERFHGLASLLLHSRPNGGEWVPGVEMSVRRHSNSRVPEDVPPVYSAWLHGDDFALLYVVNNDASEVTGINIKIPATIPFGQEVYDMTDFVRYRNWHPMAHERHIEMFPGQGQVFMFAPPEVARRERNFVIERMVWNDRRQIGIDLGVARRYEVDITSSQELIKRTGLGDPMDDLRNAADARADLINMLGAHQALVTSRSALVQASAAICGCDGVLCRMFDQGRMDEAHENGRQVLPLARTLTELRLKLRRGHAASIQEQSHALAQSAIALLQELRTICPH